MVRAPLPAHRGGVAPDVPPLRPAGDPPGSVVIVFARHGETAPNREGRILGRAADPELTDEGRRQAEALARLLRREEPVA
ncbi:MAG: histidine phosphatase family protein, partial [Acidimicrobiia bacterium]